jgi:hypothetical protein
MGVLMSKIHARAMSVFWGLDAFADIPTGYRAGPHLTITPE